MKLTKKSEKRYLVKATADICIEVSTDKPENVKSIVENYFNESCISAKLNNISIQEEQENGSKLSPYESLYKSFIGRRSL